VIIVITNWQLNYFYRNVTVTCVDHTAHYHKITILITFYCSDVS